MDANALILPGRLYTVAELVDRTDTPERPIRAAVRRGELPTARIDSWTRIWGADFLDWVESRKATLAEPDRCDEIRRRARRAAALA